MLKIDFYILAESGSAPRLQFACRLIEKAYQNKHRVYVHTEDQNTAHALDEMLWTYRDDSFIPHNLYGDGPDPAPPVQIGYAATPEKQRDILINLSKAVPAFYQQFNRLIEIIPQEPELQARGRENYRFYRSQGYEIATHKLEEANTLSKL